MANNRMTEGVGKKIVEALKMQSDDIEVNPNNAGMPVKESPVTMEDESVDDFSFGESNIIEEPHVADDFGQSMEDDDFESVSGFGMQQNIETPVAPVNNFQPQSGFETHAFETPVMPQPQVAPRMGNVEEFEVPSNIAVLRQLITKLPAGVTKQTGAMIIKQTMEALGISMKSVLQEAQQVQESLNNSTRECQASIIEYKKQIGILEKQAQKYQRQYAALNDVISLFIQTNF